MKTTVEILTILFFFFLMIHFIKELRVKHADDIRVVGYLYSLTIVLSSLIGGWGVYVQAIDEKGAFIGDKGDLVNTLVISTLDINLNAIIIFAGLAIILLPQVLNYVICGFIGIAKSPTYVSTSFSLVAWGLVKTFIIASGVMSTILMFGLYLSWDGFEVENSPQWTLTCVTTALFSFLLLMMYRRIRFLKDKLPIKLSALFSYLDKKATRHLPKS